MERPDANRTPEGFRNLNMDTRHAYQRRPRTDANYRPMSNRGSSVKGIAGDIMRSVSLRAMSAPKERTSSQNKMSMYCMHCEKPTDFKCKICNFGFCNTICMHAARKEHMSFCGLLVKSEAANLSDRMKAVQMEALHADTASISSNDSDRSRKPLFLQGNNNEFSPQKEPDHYSSEDGSRYSFRTSFHVPLQQHNASFDWSRKSYRSNHGQTRSSAYEENQHSQIISKFCDHLPPRRYDGPPVPSNGCGAERVGASNNNNEYPPHNATGIGSSLDRSSSRSSSHAPFKQHGRKFDNRSNRGEFCPQEPETNQQPPSKNSENLPLKACDVPPIRNSVSVPSNDSGTGRGPLLVPENNESSLQKETGIGSSDGRSQPSSQSPSHAPFKQHGGKSNKSRKSYGSNSGEFRPPVPEANQQPQITSNNSGNLTPEVCDVPAPKNNESSLQKETGIGDWSQPPSESQSYPPLKHDREKFDKSLNSYGSIRAQARLALSEANQKLQTTSKNSENLPSRVCDVPPPVPVPSNNSGTAKVPSLVPESNESSRQNVTLDGSRPSSKSSSHAPFNQHGRKYDKMHARYRSNHGEFRPPVPKANQEPQTSSSTNSENLPPKVCAVPLPRDTVSVPSNDSESERGSSVVEASKSIESSSQKESIGSSGDQSSKSSSQARFNQHGRKFDHKRNSYGSNRREFRPPAPKANQEPQKTFKNSESLPPRGCDIPPLRNSVSVPSNDSGTGRRPLLVPENNESSQPKETGTASSNDISQPSSQSSSHAAFKQHGGIVDKSRKSCGSIGAQVHPALPEANQEPQTTFKNSENLPSRGCDVPPLMDLVTMPSNDSGTARGPLLVPENIESSGQKEIGIASSNDWSQPPSESQSNPFKLDRGKFEKPSYCYGSIGAQARPALSKANQEHQTTSNSSENLPPRRCMSPPKQNWNQKPEKELTPNLAVAEGIKTENVPDVEGAPGNELKDIVFNCSDSRGWWVSPAYSKIENEIADYLASDDATKMPVASAQEGLICLAPYQGGLYRAYVISAHEKVTVSFVDYGNQGECDKTDLLQVPDHIRSLPPQAFLVELSEEDKQIHASADLSERHFVTKFTKTGLANPKYTVDLLWEVLHVPFENFPTNCCVVASALVGAHGIAVCRPTNHEKFKELAKRLEAEHVGAVTGVQPQNDGQFVLAYAQHSGQFQRAQVRRIDKEMVTLQYIDDGFVRSVSKTYIKAILPDEQQPAGALCVWPQLDRPFTLQKDLILFYEKLIEKQTPLTLVFDGNPCNGCKLLFRGKCCSLIEQWSEEHVYSGEKEDLFSAFESASPLHVLPAIGSVILAFSTIDQDYYRARILNHEEDKALVQFIESGVKCKVGLDNLRPIAEVPASMKHAEDRGAVKVMSADLGDSKIGNEDYLGFVPLNEGNIKLFIVTCNSKELRESGVIHVMNLEHPTTCYILGEFLDDIKWFCENKAKHAYCPRVSELCFAYISAKDVWLRAKCLNNTDPKNVVLSVVDLGTVVTLDCDLIRVKAPWATGCPAAVTRCIVEGFEKFTDDNFDDVLNVVKESENLHGYVRLINHEYLVAFPALEGILR